MKSEYSLKIEKLEAQLAVSDESPSVDSLLNKGMETLLRLDYIYESGDVEK